MRATGKPGATRSLIGRSELVDWCLDVRRVCFACAMDNLCHVSTSRETSRHHVRVQSCPALNSLTAVGPYMGPFIFELRASLITIPIFVRCQRLIARNVADGFLLFSLVDTF